MAQGDILKGKNLRFKFNTKTLYHATSCGMSSSSATDELATKDTSGTIVSMGDISRTLTTDSLIYHLPTADEATSVDWTDLLEFQNAATELDFEFSLGAAGDQFVSGKCFVQQVDVTADNGSNASGSFSFIVNGDITIGVKA